MSLENDLQQKRGELKELEPAKSLRKQMLSKQQRMNEKIQLFTLQQQIQRLNHENHSLRVELLRRRDVKHCQKCL